jgi:membrane protein
MIVLSQIAGLFSISLGVLDELINLYVFEDVAEMLLDFIAYSPTGAMNAAFVAISVWSATKVQFCLMKIANYTISEGQVTGKGFFRDRAKAAGTVLFTLFMVAFALVVLVYGEPLSRLVLNFMRRTLEIEYEIANALWFLRWPAALALYFLMVSFNYYVLPYMKVKYREVMPGSIFASSAIVIITYLYSAFIKFAWRYDILYGTLASAVALLFWFFFLSWTLGLGVLFNKSWADTKGL